MFSKVSFPEAFSHLPKFLAYVIPDFLLLWYCLGLTCYHLPQQSCLNATSTFGTTAIFWPWFSRHISSALVGSVGNGLDDCRNRWRKQKDHQDRILQNDLCNSRNFVPRISEIQPTHSSGQAVPLSAHKHPHGLMKAVS